MKRDRTAPLRVSPFTRRAFVWRAGVGTLAGGMLATAGAQSYYGGDHPASSDASPASVFDGTAPRIREVELIAGEFDLEIMPGVTVPAWGYNRQVPGPEIRVREGDLVRVTLRNRLPVPTTIHWHGVHTRPEMDGPAGLNQAPVQPGEDFIYEFTATPGGTRWYHSHADPALQVPIGLYGPLVIEPAVAPRPYAYDREYTLMLGEWDMELTPAVAAGRAARGAGDQALRGGELGADMFLVNGRAHGAIAPIVVRTGERVLLRMINAGHLAHPVHMHGHSFRIVATDGNPVPAGMEWVKDTVLIGSAERYDLEFEANNPGVWMFHCHIEHHMANGMMTVIQYEGSQPTGPAGAYYALATGGGTAHAHVGPSTFPDATPTPAEPAAAPTGATAEVAMVDDRFDPVDLTVAAGTTVTWANKGSDWHSIAAYDGSFEADKIAPGTSYSYRFTAPGTYPYICKHHAMQGMIGKVTVDPAPA